MTQELMECTIRDWVSATLAGARETSSGWHLP
jgi:hypothetical protein